MSTIPEDLFEEILYHLPVYSLLRFKSVCKSWHAIITNPTPRFITNHHNHYKQHLIVDKNIIPTTNKKNTLNIQYHDILGMTKIVGSSNGLVCLSDELSYRMMLWNPAMREFRFIPQSSHNVNAYPHSFYGFGYEPVTLDYKILRTDMHGFSEVYSKNSDTWNKVTCNPFLHTWSNSTPDLVMKGRLHWSATIGMHGEKNHHTVYKGVIMCFDLVNEVFSYIENPPFSDLSNESIISVFEESLAILHHGRSSIDIWLMKDYGVEGSWIKHSSIRHFSDIVMSPFGCLNSDDLILEYIGFGLFLYNLRTQKFRCLPGLHAEYVSEVYPYTESLASVKPGLL